MRLALLVALAFMTVASHPAAASNTFAPPSPNLLFQLEKQNRSHPWLRVATDSARLTLKVRRIDQLGLHGLIAPADAPPSHDPLSWREIKRIDEVVTRAQRGRVMGSLVLGLAGAGLGNALGAPNGDGGNDAMLGFVVLGGVGGWLGGVYGERFKHERNWYVADTARRMLSVAPTTSVEPLASPAPLETVAPAPLETVAPAPSLGMSPAMIRVSNRIGKDDVLRVTGSFGSFQGFADLVGPTGLEGLRADRKAHGEWAHGKVPERIPWETIDEVRMRGGTGTNGALVGAGSFAAVGALFGLAAVAVLGDGSVSVVSGALVGAGIAAPFGALFGAGAGALVRRWVVVYRAGE
jgi:hypothetical protein